MQRERAEMLRAEYGIKRGEKFGHILARFFSGFFKPFSAVYCVLGQTIPVQHIPAANRLLDRLKRKRAFYTVFG